MAGRGFVIGVVGVLVLVLPGVAWGGGTEASDFVQVTLRHSEARLGPQMGVLAVVPPGGHHVLLADDGVTCHNLGGDCGTRIALPEGIEAGGVWTVAYAPQRTHNLLTTACYLGIPWPPPWFGGYWCIVSGPWPDAPYVQYDLGFEVAGWQGAHSIRCLTTTGAVWTLDHDERTITPTCARWPVV